LAFGRVSFSDPVKVPPGFVSWGKAAWNGPLGFGRGFHTIESDLLAAVFFLAVIFFLAVMGGALEILVRVALPTNLEHQNPLLLGGAGACF